MSYTLTVTSGEHTRIHATNMEYRTQCLEVQEAIEFGYYPPERTHRWRDPWMVEGYWNLKAIKTTLKHMQIIRVSVVSNRLWCLWESL